MDFNSVVLLTVLLTPVQLYVSHFNGTSQHLTLCTPIICKGQIRFCKTNFTSDECQRCPPGTYMLDSVNSSLYDNDKDVIGCIERGPWSCPPESRFLDESTDTSDICECDTSRGYYGRDYRLCRTGKVCPAGEELNQDGLCQPCPRGYYKTSEGYGPCIAVTDCKKLHRIQVRDGSSTRDSECGGKIKTTTTVRPTQTTSNFHTTSNRIAIGGNYLPHTLPMTRQNLAANNQSERSELTSDVGYISQKHLHQSNISKYLNVHDLKGSIEEVRGQVSGLLTWVYVLVIFNVIIIISGLGVVILFKKKLLQKPRIRKKRTNESDSIEIQNLDVPKLPISCSDQNDALLGVPTHVDCNVIETIKVQDENV